MRRDDRAEQYVDFDGWLARTHNYDGTVADRTGRSEVTVEVGVGEGGLAFAPPAVRVSKGATVVWRWTGRSGGHNVHAQEGASFESEIETEGTFEWTAAERGTVKYQCDPHAGQGMRGVLVVE